ncbi:MAG: hypothetical protein AVDCRST_MAG70-188, partial [uncultured Thermomicrobiales bacterium]
AERDPRVRRRYRSPSGDRR